jgi:hypothetical protein
MTSKNCIQRSHETENLLKRLHGLTPDQLEALIRSVKDMTAQNAALGCQPECRNDEVIKKPDDIFLEQKYAPYVG